MWSSSSSSADLVGRRGQRLDLLEDVQAVGLLLDEPLDAARLALDPPQAGDEVPAVLRVGVAEVRVGRIGRHTAGQYAGGRPAGQSSASPNRGSMADEPP